MLDKNGWHMNAEQAFADARRTEKPVFLFFGSNLCSCNQMKTDLHQEGPLAELIQSELIGLHITTETPDLFQTYAVKNVPTFIVANADGIEYERSVDVNTADDLAAFCLLALGKFAHDHGETARAQQFIERLVSSYPQSLQAPEGVFLRGVYRYMASQDPMDLKASLFMLGKSYSGSIWVRRSLVLHIHPSTVVDWEVYRRQRRDYWESQDAYLKAWCTWYNGPSVHHFNME
jgi:hypothetical protein